MSDIALCKGTDCARKAQCLRFTQAPRPKWQAYLIMQVSIKDTDACAFFIDNGENNAP